MTFIGLFAVKHGQTSLRLHVVNDALFKCVAAAIYLLNFAQLNSCYLLLLLKISIRLADQ